MREKKEKKSTNTHQLQLAMAMIDLILHQPQLVLVAIIWHCCCLIDSDTGFVSITTIADYS
jgi:hypothetical protein